MKPDEPYPLSGLERNSGIGPKVTFVIVVLIAVGPIAWIKWKEKNATQPVPVRQVSAEVTKPKPATVVAMSAPEALKPAPVISNAEKELAKKNAELIAANERLAAQLKSQAEESRQPAKKAKEAEEPLSAAKGQRMLNQVVLKLERVTNEPDNFSSYSYAGELAREESRLKTIAREQESAARSLVADLKELGFPNADKLDSLIKDFTNNYVYCVQFKKTSWQLVLMSGQISEKAQAEVSAYQMKYYRLLARIKSFPKEIDFEVP